MKCPNCKKGSPRVQFLKKEDVWICSDCNIEWQKGHIYKSVAAGEWIQPINKGYRMACCDCSLTHLMNFRIYKGRVQFQAFRDNKATANKRRFAKINTSYLKDAD